MFTFIENMIAPVFYKLLYMSVTALVIGMIIMLIRRIADKRFSPFWKYAMWTLVLTALIIPWRPQSNLAVMNTTESIQDVSFREEYEIAQIEYRDAQIANVGDRLMVPEPSEEVLEAKTKADSLHLKTLIFDNVIPAVWLCGTVIMGVFMLFGGLRLGRKIKKSKIIFETEKYENIFQNCKQKLGIKRKVALVMQSHVKTPALFGIFRPKIILPEYVKNLSDEHFEYVILHELSHLKRGDGVVNTLLLLLQTVYWFNPLIWVLFKFIREDMEIANDAAVLKGMGAKEQKEYSLSLVEVLAGYSKPAIAPRLLCMVDNEKNMTRRINMIKLGEFFKRRRLMIAIAGLLIIATTATLFLTVGAAENDVDKYKIEITSEMVDRVDQISQEYYQTQIQEGEFLITAFKIHAIYKTNGEIKVFVTTLYSTYVANGEIIQKSTGVVPAVIDYEEEFDGYLRYTEANEGELFSSSIEDFCKLSSGQKIDGLASEMIEYYGNHEDLKELHQQRLDEYINKNKLVNNEIPEPKMPENEPEVPEKSDTESETKETELPKPKEPEPEELDLTFNSDEEVENMTDAQLLALVAQTERFTIDVSDFYSFEDFGIPLKDYEYYYSTVLSVSSATQALAQIKERADVQDAQSIEYIGENKYCYIIRVVNPTRARRYVVYKEEAMNRDNINIKFNFLDSKSVLELLDLKLMSDFMTNDLRFIYRDFEEAGNEYIYTLYSTEKQIGDFGMSDRATLRKLVIKIDKNTGEYMKVGYFYPFGGLLKEIIIPGTQRPSGNVR